MNDEIAKRRTFAIISHPDAGKTTLTEKFLLYGGALQLAGSVTARKQQRDTVSDWMELEKKRGISISSTVLQFNYGPWRMNLLDTPGHKDFSEDTYRVLMAVDGVVMVIDAGKGIEAQTKKLFQICRERKVPIFTFMNKLDRPSKHPLELIDEVESVLNVHAYPVNWPLGNGQFFKGIYDRLGKQVHLYERTAGGAYKAPVSIHALTDALVQRELDEETYRHVVEDLEILESAHGGFDAQAVLRGETTPVYFGSASNNFGIQALLDGYVQYSSPPVSRRSTRGLVPVESPIFSGYVFKIQTNMNPLHRDRIAFMRVCAGVFKRDMTATNTRTGAKVRLSDSHSHLGKEREIMNEGHPGDIIGLVSKTDLRIGDTLSEDPAIVYDEVPRFSPECFATISNQTTSQVKSFRKGIDHLLSENIVQSFRLRSDQQSPLPLLGAVGLLQFEVLQYRLKNEYGADCAFTTMPWKLLRWIVTDLEEPAIEKILPYGASLAEDESGRLTVLFTSDWSLEKMQEENADKLRLLASPKRLGRE